MNDSPSEPTAEILGPDWPLPTTPKPGQVFYLRVIESTGPFEDELGHETGQECPRCHRRPERGEEVVRLGDQWWHLGCAAQHMRAGGAAAAWLALGADLAARPSKYGVTETRAIVRQLLTLTAATETLCPDCGLNRTHGQLTAPAAPSA